MVFKVLGKRVKKEGLGKCGVFGFSRAYISAFRPFGGVLRPFAGSWPNSGSYPPWGVCAGLPPPPEGLHGVFLFTLDLPRHRAQAQDSEGYSFFLFFLFFLFFFLFTYTRYSQGWNGKRNDVWRDARAVQGVMPPPATVSKFCKPVVLPK